MKRKLLCALLGAGLLLLWMPVAAWGAETSCEYVDKNGAVKTVTATIIDGTEDTLTDGWYVVQDPGVTRSATITIDGDVHLILADGASLTVTGNGDHAGIEVTGDNSLAIYGQSLGTGTLSATGGPDDESGAGIGSSTTFDEDAGPITINGGTINATGGPCGAGIGGGSYTRASTVDIYGGTVNAVGTAGGAGIGGYRTINGGSSTVRIYGGTVNAMGSDGEDPLGCGAGIGGNYGCNGGTVYIYGGTVKATGGYCGEGGAGIGGGPNAPGGVVYISGGTVTAQGGDDAAGIGGGDHGDSGSVYISGGTVNAMGGGRANDIGAGWGGIGAVGTLMNKPAADGGADVFLTEITLDGINTETPISAITTSVSYYGLNDVTTDASGKIYLYLPQGTVTLSVATADSHFTGGAATVDVPAFFTFTQSSSGRDIELRTTETHIQWRYTDETEWHDLAALADITGPGGETGPTGADGRDIELRKNDTHIQWRYEGETEWHDLVALSDVIGPQGNTGPAGPAGADGKDGVDGKNGTDGKDGQNGVNVAAGAASSAGTNGRDGQNGKDGRGITSITKTGTEGNVDTYTIVFTDETETTFTVTNGRDGIGITGTAVNEKGEAVFALADGTQVKIDDGILPAGAAAPDQGGGNATATVSLVIAIAALLSHLGWLIPLLLKKKA